MTRLTTHVLDTATGRPAGGVTVRLHSAAAPATPVACAVTDADGRALLVSGDLASGVYDLVFAMGPYFANPPAAPAFFGDIIIRVGIDAAQSHYHIPLLASPWSYTTYRGS
ncbi:hydroxyisourate hydrolase [Acidiphilium sp. PA]|uniref:hydroxyisourate hydrolase n=1 Tax=Acidiphilium sp. PA TaxID=2871705 RepID=UPI0022449C63|nr:hydroxyisourate hydrolase [Acidiphilium sp. PA]MCW8308242.1 hydroxyisourate hydrolase [Acidiphilium sp. PA]